MGVTIDLVLALHIIGIAALLGGVLAQLKALRAGDATVTPGMPHGALTMLVTGVALVGLNQADDQEVNNTKIGIKMAVLIVILVLVYINRGQKVSSAIMGAIGLLTVTNIVIATVW
ncbi:hypothetical protein [Streptomyces triticirhizae]|uniref:Integral membrane protein n=1 Tax=Streptomyces triticirhizae TaxID=2483353 RepID=A0A3M2LJ86_9ACTN|nr:hypothetical protein [Streptomyces triticirhizae]RMI37539.1 hypothetical protein EBN88_18875 [Streptomyces triticirhizae]